MAVIGIDGGGTNTRACIMDLEGEILAVGKSGASSVDSVTIEKTKESIEKAVANAISKCIVDIKCDSIFACLGGVVSLEDKEAVEEILKKLEIANNDKKEKAKNDMKAAWAGGVLLEPGIALILGTGSVAYAYNGEDKEHKSGGWGYKEGDPGSAFDLGMSAIRKMVRAYDGRKEKTEFTIKVFEELGLKKIEEIAPLLHKENISRTEIASLAPIVTKYADEGDIIAREIINRAVEEVAEMIDAAYKNVFTDEEVECAVIGSLGNSGGYFGNKLLEEIKTVNSKIKIIPAKEEAVVGSCLLALQNLGIDTSIARKNIIEKNKKKILIYPMSLKKHGVEKIWGGNAFVEKLGFKDDSNRKIGELWEVSVNEIYNSIIHTGEYEGELLSEVIKKFPEKYLGERVSKKYNKQFPLLLKFLDVNDRLSLQVHPPDSYAVPKEHSLGKAEIWYVLDASEDAEIVLGLNDISKDDILDKVIDGSIEEHFNTVKVKTGDSIYIEPGMVHASHRGSVLIYEIQENSDITYRMYDYNRVQNGKKRELHLNEALNVIDLSLRPIIKNEEDRQKEYVNGNCIATVARTEYFFVDKIKVNKKFTDVINDAFKIYSVINGEGVIYNDNFRYNIEKGDTFFIPAYLDIFIEGNLEIIKTWI